MAGPVDPLTWIERVGAPITIAICLVIIVFRMIQAYRDDRKNAESRDKRDAERDAEAQKRDDERQAQQFKFLQAQIEQNTLLRDALEKQSISFVKALEANTDATNNSARAITDGLSQILGKALESHTVIIHDVNAHADLVQANLSGAIAAATGELTTGQARVAANVSTLARAVATHDDMTALTGAVEAQRVAHEARDAENANTANELRRLAELVESARNVKDEQAQVVVQEIMKAIMPKLDQITETLRVVLERVTPPVVAPPPHTDPLTQPQKHATGTLPALPSDAPDAKRDTEAT